MARRTVVRPSRGTAASGCSSDESRRAAESRRSIRLAFAQTGAAAGLSLNGGGPRRGADVEPCNFRSPGPDRSAADRLWRNRAADGGRGDRAPATAGLAQPDPDTDLEHRPRSRLTRRCDTAGCGRHARGGLRQRPGASALAHGAAQRRRAGCGNQRTRAAGGRRRTAGIRHGPGHEARRRCRAECRPHRPAARRPYSYFGSHLDQRVQPQRPELVATALVPDHAPGPRTASLGLAASVGNALPARLANGMFIGQHGSWNRRPHSGCRAIYVPFEGSQPTGAPPRDVLTGCLDDEGHAYGRPVGVAVERQGGLPVADDVGSLVWRVATSSRCPARSPGLPTL